ncbi:hypothetical protein FJY90_06595, partial [Candidatus Gottesmanbacteria bacterium]|nr:hypothetical protein [Candidatus Gottesmanbacteria bacterium]
MIKKIFLALLGSTFFFFIFPKEAKATGALDCPLTLSPPYLEEGIQKYSIIFDGKGIEQKIHDEYPSTGKLLFSFPGNANCPRSIIEPKDYSEPTRVIEYYNPFVYKDDCSKALVKIGTYTVEIVYDYGGTIAHICRPKQFTVHAKPSSCKVEAKYTGKGDADDNSWNIYVYDVSLSSKYGVKFSQWIWVDMDNTPLDTRLGVSSTPKSIPIPVGLRYASENHWAKVYAVHNITNAKTDLICSTKFEIARPGTTPKPTKPPTPTPTIPTFCKSPPCSTGDCTGQCEVCPGCVPAVQLTALCDQLHDANYRAKCWKCQADKKHIWTAIGCLPTNLSLLLKDYIFTFGIGITGGIAFLYFIYGAFLVLTSMGNAERIEEGKQIIVSAL